VYSYCRTRSESINTRPNDAGREANDLETEALVLKDSLCVVCLLHPYMDARVVDCTRSPVSRLNLEIQ
jgi:hypothetical protein